MNHSTIQCAAFVNMSRTSRSSTNRIFFRFLSNSCRFKKCHWKIVKRSRFNHIGKLEKLKKFPSNFTRSKLVYCKIMKVFPFLLCIFSKVLFDKFILYPIYSELFLTSVYESLMSNMMLIKFIIWSIIIEIATI